MAAHVDVQHEYVERVESLLEQIKELVLKIDPSAEAREFQTEVEERELGTYMAPAVEFTLSNGKRITAMPMGCVNLGGAGRLDILGGRVGSEMFMYLHDEGPFFENTANPRAVFRAHVLVPRPPVGWAWIPRELGKWHPINESSIRSILSRVG